MDVTVQNSEPLDARQMDQTAQREQSHPDKEKIAKMFQTASATFAAQFKQPDGYKFSQDCDNLLRFLNTKISAIEESEQKLLVQAVQVACAMNENAINNPRLSAVERLSHQFATFSLLSLCESLSEKHITSWDVLFDAYQLQDRAFEAHAKAMGELDGYTFFQPDTDHGLLGSEDNTSATGAVASTPPAVVEPAAPAAPPKVVTRKVSVQDVMNNHLTRPSGGPKDKALVMIRDQPHAVGKAAPLGRRHTMPAPYSSRTSAGWTSKVHAREHGLHAVQEGAE